MKKIFSLFLLALATVGVATAQDAEYQLIRHTYKVNADGTSEFNHRKELKLLRKRAFSLYGETFVQYNPAFESVKINEAYTLRQDGSRVEMPENAFVEQLPRECANCARFNGLRELAIVHTALEDGATIVLDYTVNRKSNVLYESLQLQQPCPVKRYEIVVDMPAGSKFTHERTTPLEPIASIIEPNDGHTYHLIARDVKPTYVDNYLPRVDKIYDIVRIGSPDLLPPSYITNQHLGLVYENNFRIKEAEPVLSELEISVAKKGNFERLGDYVKNSYRTVGDARPELSMSIALGESKSIENYIQDAAVNVWKSGCGTVVEKAALLAQLALQAGYNNVYLNWNGVNPSVSVMGDGVDFTETYFMSDTKYETPTWGLWETFKCDTLAWNGEELADGYYRFVLPSEKPFYNSQIDASQLSSVRTAPVSVGNAIDATFNHTVLLPKGYKLVGGEVKVSDKATGVGEVSIHVKQGGKQLKIERHLKIEQDIILAKDYAAFRRLMQLWSQYTTFYFKAK